MDTATKLAKTAPFKFQDWAVSLIDGFAANPKKVGDDGVNGFGMLFNTPDNFESTPNTRVAFSGHRDPPLQ